MRKLTILAVTVALGALALTACFPPPDTRTAVEKCEEGHGLVAAIQPGVVFTPHTCYDFSTDADATNDGYFGVYYFFGVDSPQNHTDGNTHGDWAAPFDYGEMWAHEHGHGWDFNRLNDTQRARIKQIMGVPFSPNGTEAKPIPGDVKIKDKAKAEEVQTAALQGWDVEWYAELFRRVAFNGTFNGSVAVSDAQRNALCGEGLVPC